MDCDQAPLVMTAHLGGSETLEEWEGLRHHLRSCQVCRAEAEALIGTWEALPAWPDAEPPPGAWERIQAHLPVAEAAGRAPWAAMVATAGLGVLLSIVASWLLPYERAVSLCGEALRRLSPFLAGLPDPTLFLLVGTLYGLLPLALAAMAAARRLARNGGNPGIGTGLVFGVLALPYVIITCSELSAIFTAALMAGILAGALAGGPAGIWAGRRILAPAPS